MALYRLALTSHRQVVQTTKVLAKTLRNLALGFPFPIVPLCLPFFPAIVCMSSFSFQVKEANGMNAYVLP